MPKKKYFIQAAHIKKGALHRQLGIPLKKKLSKTYLQYLLLKKSGSYIHTRYKGKITKKKVTPLLKKRVNFALNIRR